MPWKATKDPYKIWLSEIILQQTRVEQGRPYYLKFIAAFPTIKDLAEAPEEQVMKLWQGLGYYSRARNLHAAAKHVMEEHLGVFPKEHKDILALKGVGPYTAAAIASFAYELSYAVVDGNVYRVLARYFGIHSAIDSSKGQKEFRVLAQELMDENQASKYNQAIMDFGATQCKPGLPHCEICPLSSACVSYDTDLVKLLPIKEKKLKKKNRYFYYFVIRDAEGLYLAKREKKDIWQHLYDFPSIESAQLKEPSIVINEAKEKLRELELEYLGISDPYKQVLSHQNITAYYLEFESSKNIPDNWKSAEKATKTKLKKYALPRIVERYLLDKSLISKEGESS